MDLEVGMIVECIIDGTHVSKGLVIYNNEKYYIAQNEKNGSEANVSTEYRYTWAVGNGIAEALKIYDVTLIKINGEYVDGIHSEPKKEPTYDYWKQEARLALESNDIPISYFNDLEADRLKNKAELNRILGLTEENNYRKIINTRTTDGRFKVDFPDTIKFILEAIKSEVGETAKYSVLQNKVYTEPNKYRKLSKVLTAYYKKLESYTDTYNLACREMAVSGIDSLISSLVDMCKPKEVVISTNIFDMLTSSTYSSYSSCYRMNDGEYFNGNIAYIRDSFTAISFTHSGSIRRKIGRAWIYTFPEEFKIVTPGRPYGSMYVHEKKLVREFIEHKINEEYNIKGYWKYIKQMNYCDDDFSYGRHAVYFDYDMVQMAYHARKTTNKLKHLIFEQSMCLECGDLTYAPEAGICEECNGGRYFCTHCEEYFHNNPSYTANNECICSYCRDDNYATCDECGNLHYYEDMYNDDDGTYCETCFEQYYTRCVECEYIIRNNDAHEVDGKTYCSECFGEKCGECKDCGEIHETDNMTEVDDELYCDNCYEKAEERVEANG